jgi:hypothetical protein
VIGNLDVIIEVDETSAIDVSEDRSSFLMPPALEKKKSEETQKRELRNSLLTEIKVNDKCDLDAT